MKSLRKEQFIASLIAAALLLALIPFAALAATPSTNNDNRDSGWAHVNVTEVTTDDITFELVSTRSFASCFEYRTDGDTS